MKMFRTLVFPVILLTSCATTQSGNVPNLVSKNQVEQMAEVSWHDTITRIGLSENIATKTRFESVANKVISASSLSEEDWDVKLLAGQNPLIFSLPGNRLAGRGIETMSDDRIASMAAFGIASLELRHAQQMASRQVLGKTLLSTTSLLGAGKNSTRDKLLLSRPAPPTVEMRKEATERAEEIIITAGFTPDFLISTNPLSLGGPIK